MRAFVLDKQQYEYPEEFEVTSIQDLVVEILKTRKRGNLTSIYRQDDLPGERTSIEGAQ